MREGKGCLVMHVKSAVYTLLSQLSILFYISLSFPLSLFFHFQLTILILLVTMFSLLPCVLLHIHRYCSLLYSRSSLGDFPFLPLLSTNNFVYYRHSANTHNILFWPCVGGFNFTTFWLLEAGLVQLLNELPSSFRQKPIQP